MGVDIRPAEPADARAIERIHRCAFPENEGEAVAALAVRLLEESSVPETLSWVAVRDPSVIGHIALSPVYLEPGSGLTGYLLSPLGVLPEGQKGGVGKALVTNGLAELKGRSIDVALVYGDPKYYGRFGFSADVASQFEPPFDLEFPFGWQGLALNPAAELESSVGFTCVAPLDDPSLW